MLSSAVESSCAYLRVLHSQVGNFQLLVDAHKRSWFDRFKAEEQLLAHGTTGVPICLLHAVVVHNVGYEIGVYSRNDGFHFYTTQVRSNLQAKQPCN
jgi:hypothetical protein